MQRTILIVGLGNFGKEYENTFHNLGFLAIDTLATKLSKQIKKAECASLTATFSYKGKRIVLAKPQTYMNLSGQAVKSLMKKYNVEIEDVIILFDDIYLERFAIRAREFGSAGTHNGMKNIIEILGTDKIKRVRFGIGQERGILKDYVLSKISSDDLIDFEKVCEIFADAFIKYLLDDNFMIFMQINGNKI